MILSEPYMWKEKMKKVKLQKNHVKKRKWIMLEVVWNCVRLSLVGPQLINLLKQKCIILLYMSRKYDNQIPQKKG